MLRRQTLLCLVVGTISVAVPNLVFAQDSSGGVSPTPTDPKQFSLDEGNVGVFSPVTPVDANDLSSATPGIEGMGYLYQTFNGNLQPFAPMGLQNAVVNPFDLGLRRNIQQPGAPRQTHKDEVDALSYGSDFLFLDGTLTGNTETTDTPFFERDLFPGAEPLVVGSSRLGIEFSTDADAKGVAGSGVAGVVASSPLKPSSHVYLSPSNGVNTVLYTQTALGIFYTDNVDAYENAPTPLAPLQTPNELALTPNTLMSKIYYSVDNETIGYSPAATGIPNAVNTQSVLREAAGDIFVAIGNGSLLLVDEGQLGLWAGGDDLADNLDALVLLVDPALVETRIQAALDAFDPKNPNSGLGITQPLLTDADQAHILFSVAEGGIGLDGSAVDYEHRINASEESADLFYSNLTGQNWLMYEATDLALLEHDELNALDTQIPEPGTLALALMALLCVAWRLGCR